MVDLKLNDFRLRFALQNFNFLKLICIKISVATLIIKRQSENDQHLALFLVLLHGPTFLHSLRVYFSSLSNHVLCFYIIINIVTRYHSAQSRAGLSGSIYLIDIKYRV